MRELSAAQEEEEARLKQVQESKAQTERVRLLLLQALPEGLSAEGHLRDDAGDKDDASLSQTPVAVRLRDLELELADLGAMRAASEQRIAAAAASLEQVSHHREQVLAVLAATRKRRGAPVYACVVGARERQVFRDRESESEKDRGATTERHKVR